MRYTVTQEGENKQGEICLSASNIEALNEGKVLTLFGMKILKEGGKPGNTIQVDTDWAGQMQAEAKERLIEGTFKQDLVESLMNVKDIGLGRNLVLEWAFGHQWNEMPSERLQEEFNRVCGHSTLGTTGEQLMGAFKRR